MVPVRLPDPKPYRGIAGLIIAVESASSFTELVHSGKVRDLVQQQGGAWPNTFRTGSLIPASDYLRAMQVRRLLHAARGRVEPDLPDGRPQAVARQVEVFERAADENARRVHRVFERVLPVGQQHARAAPREQLRHLEPRQPRPHDHRVETLHVFFLVP